jgi:TM2 domain-containing membrane protein YozV
MDKGEDNNNFWYWVHIFWCIFIFPGFHQILNLGNV